MKKISAFITTGVENVIPVLEALDAAADAFPPLKSAASGALFILKAYNEFKSNQTDWDDFVEYITQAVACVSATVLRSGNPAEFDQALRGLTETLNNILSEIKKEPERQATSWWIRKFLSFLKDRDKIPALETKLNRSLSNFNLGTTIGARNELAKTFDITKELVKGVEVIASEVKRLDENSTLRQLKIADGASVNRQRRCQDGTRSGLLAELEEFASARDPSSPERVLLLTGVAGCGKSAVAQSLAERLSPRTQQWPSPKLGACFNFSAQVEDRRTTKLLFSTIAFYLSAVDPSLGASIVDALSSDKTLPAATLAAQFDGLIQIPLSTLPVSPPHPIVLILDALDEISDEASLDLLTLLANDFARLPASSRVIVTCRPTPTIMRELAPATQRHIKWQQIELNNPASLADLSLVAQTRLRDIAARRNVKGPWPEPKLVERFIRKAGGLFVWVDVACKAIDARARPGKPSKARDRLNKVLHGLLAGNETEKGMNELYIRILDGCPWEEMAFLSNYRLVLGTVVALKTPLSASAINQLIGPLLKAGVDDVEDVLEPLAPVILGVSTPASYSLPSCPLEISHESFREFVTNSVLAKNRNYALNELESSQQLALQCLRVLNGELSLHAEMLQEFFPDTDEQRAIPSPKDGVVSEALGYVCDFWMGHLSVVTAPAPEIVDALRQFLRTNLIPWIKLCASRGRFHGVDILQAWLDQHLSDVQIDFASEVDLDELGQCLEAVHKGLAYMQRLEEALTACHLWVAVERQLINRDPTRLPNGLARSLHSVSNRLSDLGQREEALVAIEEAVKIYRQLATDRPAAFNPDLAISLNNLSNRLSDLGQREEALVAIEEAARIYRQLATDRPAAFNPDLAMSMNNLSNCLSDLGQRQEALVAIEEAVGIYRALATERPAAFNPDLAMSLNNLSNRLFDLGQRQEAMVAIEEAVKIYRQLVTDRPAAFNPYLASSLNNLSVRLSDLGQREEALVAIEEAVKIRRQLATDRPATFNPDLAMSLNNLSNQLSGLGQREDALVAIEEAVRIYRQLATDRPAAFNPDLAMSLDNLSNHLSDLGRREEALVAIEEAVKIRRQLATDRPAAFNADLARALNNLAWELHKLGISGGEAIMAARESIAIYRQKAAEQPAVFKHRLSVSLATLADCLSDADHHEEAFKCIEEAVAIQRPLAERHPAVFTPFLADFLKTMARCMFKQGDVAGAQNPMAEAVVLYCQLASQYPARFRPDLADALERQADYFAAVGRDAEAELARAERATLI